MARRPRGKGGGGAGALRRFHPVVSAWFRETLGAPSAPQRDGWPAIASGAHTLILAPTGTGKTLAAFLWELNALIAAGEREPLGNAVHLLYVSPLKALNNDIQRNLELPLRGVRERFEAGGRSFPDIRVAVRTGDTPASARARMLRRAPHILITTPESLHILLTSVKARGMFSALRAVIIDEIHAVAGTKRGAHLALTLERLVAQCERPPQRIGLSATQRPLEEIARFLGGVDDSPGAGPDAARTGSAAAGPRFRPVTIVDCGSVKRMETEIVSPVADLARVGGSVWPAVAELVHERMAESRTTLVFVNNRAQAERIAARINALAGGEELALPYHGSLARERRLALEQALKAGEVRALVSTSSLELGIDIGTVDLVIQLQSPKRVAAGLQRIGRAGHTLEATSRGLFVPTFRDDALELVAIVDAMHAGEVEPTRVVQNALDVLAQVVVAIAAMEDWNDEALFALVRRAYPYHALPRPAFEQVLAMLGGKYATDLSAALEPRISWDRVNRRVSAPRGSRMLAVISGGTIPDRGLYAVQLPDRTRLGELDEEFVHESRHGDVFQLGSSTWRIQAIEHDRVIVVPAPGAPARMPFWHGEYAARAVGLAARIGEARRTLAAASDDDDDVLAARWRCDEATARSLREYVAAQRAATGVVPDDRTLVVEHFRDETGSVRIVVHSVFGGRVNAPWGMALAQRMREALHGVEVQVQTTDDGVMLRLPNLAGPPPIDAVVRLPAAEARQRVLEEVGTTSLFGARFRMNAARALLLPRGMPTRRMPLWLQRLKALDLLQTVHAFPDFPILVETYRDVLQDAFDLAALAELLDAVERGEVGIHLTATPAASPFAASLQFGFVMDWLYGDDTPRAERGAAMLSLDRRLLAEVMAEEGDPADEATRAAVEEIAAERRGTAAGRRARSADELAVLLDRAGDLSPDEIRLRVATADEGRREEPLEELLHAGRAVALSFRTSAGDAWRIIPVDAFGRYAAALGEERLRIVRAGESLIEREADAVVPPALRHAVLAPPAARSEVVARFVALAGIVTVADVVARYGFDESWVEGRLASWERAGTLLRLAATAGAPAWCSARVLERARRRALAALRRDIEAVEIPAFAGFLLRWQHVDPRDRVDGSAGVRLVVGQQLGLARPAEGWERHYLPARVRDYSAALLTALTSSGEVVWAAEGTRDERSGARSIARVRFLARGSGAVWLPREEESALSEPAARVRDVLVRLGASFTGELESSTGLGPIAVRGALQELVAAGLATNDTLEALREVLRWRGLPPSPGGATPDPARWLPEDWTPSAHRPVVQRRPNLRRLPKWRPMTGATDRGWNGRWALLRTPGIMGAEPDEEARAATVARQWLERYGIVSREWWRRERPPVGWRAIYRELRRMELRGEVRRGYFVRGLGGAQFAEPVAVEKLRESARETDAGEAPVFAIAASDPANPYALPLDAIGRDPLRRPRGAGAVLVVRSGRVLLAAERKGRRVRLGAGLPARDVTLAAQALAAHLAPRHDAGRRARDLTVETIDGVPATGSGHADAFRAAGFRRGTAGLRYFS